MAGWKTRNSESLQLVIEFVIVSKAQQVRRATGRGYQVCWRRPGGSRRNVICPTGRLVGRPSRPAVRSTISSGRPASLAGIAVVGQFGHQRQSMGSAVVGLIGKPRNNAIRVGGNGPRVNSITVVIFIKSCHRRPGRFDVS